MLLSIQGGIFFVRMLDFALWMLDFSFAIVPFSLADIMNLVPAGTNKQETR